MLERIELEKFGPPGFGLYQKEKDYVQHWILVYLSRAGFQGVFKGGTCLQKAFGLPRYSEDLDFTAETEPDYEGLSAFLSSAGFSGISVKREEKNQSSKAKLRLRGPLFNGNPISETTVILEFSKREKAILAPVPTQIVPPYPDLLPYQISALDKREIAAEKIRAIMGRASPRDLYDLFFLARLQAKPEKSLVNEKLAYYGEEFSAEKFEKRVRALEEEWDKEIKMLTASKVDFKQAAQQAIKLAKELEK